MADKDPGDGPSLEMPSLGSMFRRKKKDGGSTDDAQTPTAEDFDALVRGDRFEPKPDAGADQDEGADETATGNELVAPVPPVDDEVFCEPEEPEAHEPDAEPTVVVPTVPAAVSEPAEEPAVIRDARAEDAAPTTTILDEAPEPELEAEDPAPRPKREFTLPPLAARTAAAVTGLVIGILAVGLTLGSLRGCEAIKGTSSCGTPGFFLLVAIMIVLVAVGSALLGAWKVSEPSSTSFLAVGLLAVIALLFLVRVIFSPWMIIVIPIVAVVTYTASHWLTSLFDEDEVVPE